MFSTRLTPCAEALRPPSKFIIPTLKDGQTSRHANASRPFLISPRPMTSYASLDSIMLWLLMRVGGRATSD